MIEPDSHPARDCRDADSRGLVRRQGMRLVAIRCVAVGLLGCLLAVALSLSAR